MRPATKKLRAKYGKLTVVSEETINGRRTAIVNCTCGTQKRVFVDALTAGRTRSCGKPACRKAPRALPKRVKLRGSKVVPLETLKLIWAATRRKKDPLTVQQAAKQHGIDTVQSVYSVLQTVRRCGGLDEYIRRLQA